MNMVIQKALCPLCGASLADKTEHAILTGHSITCNQCNSVVKIDTVVVVAQFAVITPGTSSNDLLAKIHSCKARIVSLKEEFKTCKSDGAYWGIQADLQQAESQLDSCIKQYNSLLKM